MTTTTSDEMNTFCCSHYTHPLLWCEEKKRLMQRRNAEESLRMWRRRKAEEIARKEKEQQEYYELCLKHCPWGRPGGGAPNIDVRRKDIEALGLHSTSTIAAAHRISSMQPCRYSDYFSQRRRCLGPVASYYHRHHHEPGHTHEGAPPPNVAQQTACEKNTATTTGVFDSNNGDNSLQITLKDHPSSSFRNKGHVDIEVRYKPTGKGKPIVKKIVVAGHDVCRVLSATVDAPEEKSQKQKLLAMMEKPLSKDPWGKAGPGGKPWRSPKAVGSLFMKSLGWTNKEMLKELDQDNPATPAEKNTFRKVRPIKKLERCCELCVCKCSATSNGPLKPLMRKPSIRNPLKETSTKAGSNKQMGAHFERHCATETTTDTNVGVKVGGGVELVPLLARRRAINRPISLSSTDVTKRTNSNDRLSRVADPRYLHDLNLQVSRKRQSIGIAKQLERDLSSQHFETFNSFWGKPGHGAPSERKTKLKLDHLLYGPQTS